MKTIKNLFRAFLPVAILPLTLWAQDAPQTKAGPNPALPYKVYLDRSAFSDNSVTVAMKATLPPDTLEYVSEVPAEGGYVYSNGDSTSTNAAKVSVSLAHLPANKVYVPVVTYHSGGDVTRMASALVTPLTDDLTRWSFHMPAAPVTITFTPKIVIPPVDPDKPADPVIIGDKDISVTEIGSDNPEEPAVISTLEINASPTDILTLSNLTVKGEGGTVDPAAPTVTIGDATDVTLKVEGTNDLGTIENNGTLTLTASPDAGQEVLGDNVAVVNNGVFTDETGLIEAVTGNADLRIALHPVEQNTTPDGTVVFSVKVETLAAAATLLGTWQRLAGDGWKDVVEPVSSSAASSSAAPLFLRSGGTGEPVEKTFTLSVKKADAGTYRCQVTNTVTEGVLATTLYSNSAEASFTAAPDPVSYTITLPTVEGARLTPSSGYYTVTEGASFTFTLKLSAAYSQSDPVVMIDRSSTAETLLPEVASDGSLRYTIMDVGQDLTVSIAGIEKNPDTPTANAEVFAPEVRAYVVDGVLRIHTPVSANVYVYDFGGALLRRFVAPAGDSAIAAPGKRMIVVVGEKRFKVGG